MKKQNEKRKKNIIWYIKYISLWNKYRDPDFCEKDSGWNKRKISFSEEEISSRFELGKSWSIKSI